MVLLVDDQRAFTVGENVLTCTHNDAVAAGEDVDAIVGSLAVPGALQVHVCVLCHAKAAAARMAAGSHNGGYRPVVADAAQDEARLLLQLLTDATSGPGLSA